MARTQKKAIPIRKAFKESMISAIGIPEERVTYDDSYWIEKPVSVGRFFGKFLNEPAYLLQDEFNVAMVGKKSIEFSDEYDEGHAFWGKGSGKDSNIAKVIVYAAYKLKCLRNPQKYFRDKYGCSIGDHDQIDLVNMSINARQAQNVFFKKLKAYVRNCKNPRTGNNWFVEKGMDIRDGYDIQNTEIKFSNSISAHSLNSETHTGEGLNILLQQ